MKSINLKNILVLFLVIVLMASTLTGCLRAKEEHIENEDNQQPQVEAPEQAYPMEIEDEFGNKVTIKREPQRIISLAPSHTEILFALGLGEKIVGVTSFCDYPAQALEKEKVGDYNGMNVEKIIELEPDLVVQYGEGSDEVNKKITDAGIALLSYEPESIDETIELMQEIGRITGSGRHATMVTADMMSKKQYIINRVKDAEKPKVFYEVWHEPLQTAGPGSFLDELITMAGGENIAKDAEGAYPMFDLEQLVERNPSVYLAAQDTPDKTAETIKVRKGYQEIDAIKNNRVYVLEPNVISRPGPRIVNGLELVAKSLHPDLFD